MPVLLSSIAALCLLAAPHRHAHNRTAFGDVTIGEGEEVRSAVAIGGSVHLLAGAKAREAVAVGGSVELAPGAEVDRDVTAVGGDVSVGAGAHVGGNVTTFGGAIEVEQGGTVAGTITPHQGYDLDQAQGDDDEKPSLKLGLLWGVLWGVFQFVALFCVGVLLLLIAPRQLDGIVETISLRPWRSLFTGLLGTLLVPPILVMLVVTLIGILFIPAFLAAVGLAGAMGYAALALLVGRLIHVRAGNYAKLALGLLVVTAVSVFPIVGPVAWALGWFLVFGAVLSSRFGTHSAGAAGLERPAGPPSSPPATVVA